jgi:hypothetical protein
MAGKVKGKKKWNDTQHPKHKPKNLSVPYLRVKQANLRSVTSKKNEELIPTAAEESESRTVDLISLNKAGNQFTICFGRTT